MIKRLYISSFDIQEYKDLHGNLDKVSLDIFRSINRNIIGDIGIPNIKQNLTTIIIDIIPAGNGEPHYAF
jgi:hypothetical protein